MKRPLHTYGITARVLGYEYIKNQKYNAYLEVMSILLDGIPPHLERYVKEIAEEKARGYGSL